VFCGPAKAIVKLGSKTFTFANGECDHETQYVSVNIGTVMLGAATKKPNYFGLDVGRVGGSGSPAKKDGTFKASILSFDYGGKGNIAGNIVVTLTANRTRGTFTAEAFTGGTIRGSFSC
jgi:hypothetical protein